MLRRSCTAFKQYTARDLLVAHHTPVHALHDRMGGTVAHMFDTSNMPAPYLKVGVCYDGYTTLTHRGGQGSEWLRGS